MNLRITLLLASTLLLKIAEVQPAGLGEACNTADDCYISFSTCDSTKQCVCIDNYHRVGSECLQDCTADSCPEGESCDLDGTKECVEDQGCTESSCSAGQSCLEVDGNAVCVQNCTESSCPAGQNCFEVDGNAVCVQGCTEGSCSGDQSCLNVQENMACVQNCSESSCPTGQSCLDVQGNMVCAPECVSDNCPEGQSCQDVDGRMQCAGAAAATTASVLLLTAMTLMAFRFL